MKVLANDGVSQSGIEALENAGFEVKGKTIPKTTITT